MRHVVGWVLDGFPPDIVVLRSMANMDMQGHCPSHDEVVESIRQWRNDDNVRYCRIESKIDQLFDSITGGVHQSDKSIAPRLSKVEIRLDRIERCAGWMMKAVWTLAVPFIIGALSGVVDVFQFVSEKMAGK